MKHTTEENNMNNDNNAKSSFAGIGNKSFNFDKEAAFAKQRKNIESLTEANKMAIEVLKSISKLQSQYIRQTFEDMNEMMKDMIKIKTKEDWEKQTDKMKDGMEKATEHGKNLMGILSQSNHSIFDVMQKRAFENFEEINLNNKKK